LAKRSARLALQKADGASDAHEELAQVQAAIRLFASTLASGDAPRQSGRADNDDEGSRDTSERRLILPHPECGVTLLLVTCCELGFLPQALRVRDWMTKRQHTPELSTQQADSSVTAATDKRQRTWAAAVDRYSRMFAATRS
jgi:hypothetical protein